MSFTSVPSLKHGLQVSIHSDAWDVGAQHYRSLYYHIVSCTTWHLRLQDSAVCSLNGVLNREGLTYQCWCMQISDLKKLENTLGIAQSELRKVQEQYAECNKYCTFLDSITPTDFFLDQDAQYEAEWQVIECYTTFPRCTLGHLGWHLSMRVLAQMSASSKLGKRLQETTSRYIALMESCR